MGKKELVSVIISPYNAVGHLPQVLESVSNQTYPNLEAIVADNESTDETEHYLSNVLNFYTLTVLLHQGGELKNLNHV